MSGRGGGNEIQNLGLEFCIGCCTRILDKNTDLLFREGWIYFVGCKQGGVQVVSFHKFLTKQVSEFQ